MPASDLARRLREHHDATLANLSPELHAVIEREISARAMVTFGGVLRSNRLDLICAREAQASVVVETTTA